MWPKTYTPLDRACNHLSIWFSFMRTEIIFVVVLLSIFTEPELKRMNTILRMTKKVHIFILYFGGFPFSVVNIYVNKKFVTNKLVRVELNARLIGGRDEGDLCSVEHK